MVVCGSGFDGICVYMGVVVFCRTLCSSCGVCRFGGGVYLVVYA